MHEMSVIEALLETANESLRSCPNSRVRTVRVVVGRLRQVEPAMLEFCYEAATRDTPLSGSRLEVQQVPAVARCDVCSLEFDVEDHWFECPRCGAANARLVRGDELLLASVELNSASER